jgi:HEAT repeat protein
MKCNDANELFPDYLAGTLDDTTKSELQEHFLSCELCRQEAESLSVMWQKLGDLPDEQPSAAMRAKFYTTLANYQQEMKRAKAAPRLREALGDWLEHWLPRQPAFQFALALIFVGFGFFLGNRYDRDDGSKQEIASLRQEIHSMQQLVTLSLLQQPSPSERLRGVSWSSQGGRPDNEILAALLETLNYDPNVNVRLAAVDALSRFSDQEMVKRGLIQSLAQQRSPLIQIALIDVMVEHQERQAIGPLKQLEQKEKVDQAVRQRIEWGIQQLQ